MKNWKTIYRKSALFSALAGSLAFAGCAGDRTVPAQKIAGAEQSIEQASRSNAGADAALELKNAQDHLAEAKAAMDRREYDAASRHAESAMADAELAQAKAATAKSKKAASDMRESVNALRKELNQVPTR